MKIQNPPSLSLPFVRSALTGSPLILREVFFMEEIWKQINGYSGYEISNFGRVKSVSEKYEIIRKQVLNISGYYYVRLNKNGISKTIAVHKMVASAFLNHIPCGMIETINHKDFNKANNCLSNLEIVTNRENNNRKHLTHSSIYTGVSWVKSKNKWSAKIYYNNKSHHLGYFKTEFDAHKEYENRLLIIKKTNHDYM